MKLYTYLPKKNTALTEGLLSTALTDNGFEKYRGRTGKHTKEDVLKVLDSWEPEWTRSKAISALTEPIPEDAAEDFQEFARGRRLYSFDTKDLIKAKILAHIRRSRKGGGTDPADEVRKERPNWHRKKKHLLFQGVPHYFVETTDGRIPPEFVREEKQASAWMKKTRESAEEIAADLKKRLKYGIRYSDGTYETSQDMWDKRDARDIVVQTPEELDESGIGMCHDVTQALMHRLRDNRIRGTAVMLKGDHKPNLPTHSFVVTRRDGKYTVLDPLSYASGHKGGYRSSDDAISDRIADWKKEDEKGNVVSSRIRPRDWKMRGLLDFLGYGYEKKAAVDIPSIYEDVRKAYAGMGYPVSGDHLVLSEQPTYVDGRPVPADVLSPRSSGGNTQHDGTVRINPRYRAVMRHWKIKGPGRDFLRLIIGHELGHHIDRSVLSKPEHEEERKRLLKEIVKAKFHTVYIDSYGPDTDPRKLDKELLAEYLADMVRRKLEKKAADRNFLSAFGDLAKMPQTASNPTDDDIRAAFKVDPAKVRGHDTVPHLMASVENVNPPMGRKLWGMAKGRVLPRVSVFSGSTPRDLRSTADAMVEARKSWPNGVNTAYAAMTNMYDRVARETGKPVWDVANARPTEYGKMNRGISLNIK